MTPTLTSANPSSRRSYGTLLRVVATRAVLLSLVAVVLILLGMWPWVRSYLQSAAVLIQLNGEPLPGYLAPIAGKPFTVQEVTLSSPHGPVAARLYTPANAHNAPAAVLVHGMAASGMNSTATVELAKWEAACGFQVLTPDIPGLKQYRLAPAVVDTIGDSANWLASRTGRPVTVISVSFAGGLTLMAAARAEYAPNIRMVFETGGYDDLSRLVHFYLYGKDPRPDGTVDGTSPNPYGLLITSYIVDSVSLPAADRAALYPLVRATLSGHSGTVGSLESNLTAAQKSEWQRISSMQFNKAALPEEMKRRQDLWQPVSPHGHLAGVAVPVFILHGAGDDVIPAAEAEWMVKDLPPGRVKAMLISPIVGHVSLDGKAIVWMDKWRLVHFLAAELQAQTGNRLIL